jgi:stearoyl-CoA desaturase (delta-9 desaturase)
LNQKSDITTLTITPASQATPLSEAHADQPAPRQLSLVERIGNLLAVTLPLAGLAVAGILLWGYGFSWVHLGLLLGMYILTGLGITIGYHRLFTHKAFEARLPLKAALAVLGSMAVEGPLLKWVAVHRRHHQHSDERDDPHSPNVFGGGLFGVLKGLWHAHLGWIFKADPPQLSRYVPDLQKDGLLRVLSNLFPLWVLIGLLVPALLGGLITLSWTGALLGFIWGGLVRIFLVHHITWSINSVCHLWGSRPFRCHDESRNNLIFGVLAFGEGWHNNHHAFPTSAAHGLAWWQIDVSYWVIRVMAWLRLAYNVKIPAMAAMAAKRVQSS